MPTNFSMHFRDPEIPTHLGLAIGYIVMAYLGGWWLVWSTDFFKWCLGVIAIAHGMVISAYLMHECAHNTLFANNAYNTWLGRQLNMVCGSNYGTYDDMRIKHMRHHIDNCDTVYVDYRSWLKKHPRVLLLVRRMEWCYIPAVELMMHGIQMVVPFFLDAKRDQRMRVLRVIAFRWSLLAWVGYSHPTALIGYAVAYMLFLTVLRFMDNFQHDYELFYRLDDPGFVPPMKGNVEYEQGHTYTNLLSSRWPLLNQLVLNFGYHNAHHSKPTLPWFKLPMLNKSIDNATRSQNLDIRDQLLCFHRQRVARVLSEQYGEEQVTTALASGQAVGVNAVSFLTAF